MKKTAKMAAAPCPCGSGQVFSQCCQPLLEGTAIASTAEQLMRSRFSAYSQHNIAYLQASWHPDTCPDDLDPAEMAKVKWLDLRILGSEAGGANEDTGSVSFCARFKINGKAGRLQENSRFVRIDGRWLYLDGDIVE
jgi:SEC-C motif-containing protein